MDRAQDKGHSDVLAILLSAGGFLDRANEYRLMESIRDRDNLFLSYQLCSIGLDPNFSVCDRVRELGMSIVFFTVIYFCSVDSVPHI